MKIINGLVFNQEHKMEKKSLCFENGIITDDSDSEIFDATDCYVLPGFIDTHVHGAYGVEFYTSDYSGDYKPALDYLSSVGVTSVLVTLVSETREEYIADVKRLALSNDDRILGMHCEGPFINPVRNGGMLPDRIQKPDLELFNIIKEYSGNKLKIITVAPEIDGAKALIKEIIRCGVNVSLGHSDATYSETISAIDSGASRATHTFNAMRPFNHREPGIIGAVLTDNRVNCELICDLHHVSKPVIDLVIKSKGIDNVTIISDCSFFCGLPEGKYPLNGRDLYVERGFAKLENGTISGSACSLAAGAKNMFDIGYKPEQIAVMACVNPAKAAGCYDRGELIVGYRADVIVLDKSFNVTAVFVKGDRIK